jgi:hypothetical protein
MAARVIRELFGPRSGGQSNRSIRIIFGCSLTHLQSPSISETITDERGDIP